MKGYFNKPEATAEAIDADGWFHTGDIGNLDEDGFLAITDRKKDLIVLAGGKKAAPQPIENELKKSPYVALPIVIGDRQKFLAALIVPNFDKLKEWAAANAPDVRWETLDAHPEIRALFQKEIDTYNAGQGAPRADPGLRDPALGPDDRGRLDHARRSRSSGGSSRPVTTR